MFKPLNGLSPLDK